MLYCNDEPVLLKDNKELQKEFAKIRAMKNPIIVKSKQTMGLSDNGLREPIPHELWPLRVSSVNEDTGETQTWIWSKYSLPLKDGELVLSTRSITIESGTLSIDTLRETEKAFYILNKSGMLTSGRYELENLDAKNTEQVNVLGKNATLDFYLCSTYSPIFNDRAKLNQLGASWGLSNAENMHIDTLRTNLLAKVKNSENNYQVSKRGVQEFMDEANGDDRLSEYRALMQQAIDKKIISWNKPDNGWYLMDKLSEEKSELIMCIPATNISQKNNLLFEYLKSTPLLFNTIKEEITGVDSTIVSVDNLGYQELRKKAKEAGVNVLHKTAEDIMKEYKEKLKEQDIKEAV
jgi:hypothetical protein